MDDYGETAVDEYGESLVVDEDYSTDDDQSWTEWAGEKVTGVRDWYLESVEGLTSAVVDGTGIDVDETISNAISATIGGIVATILGTLAIGGIVWVLYKFIV